MSETFGSRLRKHREERSIALGTIARDTKISVALLEGLERDDVSRWPRGVFRRAFVRSYAQAVGLDADAVLEEFLALHPDPPEAWNAGASTNPPAEADAADEGLAGLRRRFGIRLRGLGGDRRSDPEQIQFGRLASPPAPPATAAAVPPVETAVPARDTTSAFDLGAAASACSRLACAADVAQLEAALEDVVQLLAARGVIVWSWDGDIARLRAVAACRYSPQLLSHIPAVSRDANNATAAAFRSGEVCVVPAADSSSGAVVAPVLSASGPVGVLAIELPAGREQDEAVQAITAMMAAPLALFLYSSDALAAHKRAV